MPTPLPPLLSMLEARLGLPDPLDGEDRIRAEAALDDATTLILAEVSATKAALWLADAPPVITLIALKAARREFDNPRGMDQESLGEHSVNLTDTSGVYLTGREVSQIKRAATGRANCGFVGSIRTPSAYGDGVTP